MAKYDAIFFGNFEHSMEIRTGILVNLSLIGEGGSKEHKDEKVDNSIY